MLDLWLPDGNDFEFLEWIAECHWLTDIPVIMFTASKKAEHARRTEELGGQRYLQKPAHFGSLVTAIKEELHSADMRRASNEKSNSAEL